MKFLKITFFGLIAASASFMLNAWDHKFINCTDFPIEFQVGYVSLLCKDNRFSLNPGETETIGAGGCTLKNIKVRALGGAYSTLNQTTGQITPPMNWVGERTTHFTGAATFRIYADRQMQKLVVVREGEVNCLSDALRGFEGQ